MQALPYSPCDPTQPTCSDVSVGMLQHIFGPVIDALTRGVDPSTVAASSNVLASILGYYNTGVLAVASLIISYVAIVGAVNTANDGEVMGKQWSSVWTPLRIATGGAVLLPTASGYSLIQVFALSLALWGIGFANGCQKIGMAMGILKADGIVASSYQPGSHFGMREFAKQYLPISYCARAANAIYTDPSGTPLVQANTQPDRISTINGRTEYTFFIKDRNPATILGGGEPICGTVKLSSYSPAGVVEAMGTSTSIAALHAGLSLVKFQATQQLMQDIDTWVATIPTDLNQPGWDQVYSKKINDILKAREDALSNQIASQVTDSTTSVKNGITAFMSALTNGGWAESGGWYQRVVEIKKELGDVVQESVGNASEPSLSSLPSDARAALLRSSVSTMAEAIFKKSEEPGKGYDVTAAPSADISSSIPKNSTSDINIGAIQADIDSKFGSMMNNTMQGTVSLVIGSSTDVDAITRMKIVGDSLVVASKSAELAGKILLSSAAATRAAVAGVGGVQVLGTKVDESGAMTALWDWLLNVPLKQLEEMRSHLQWVAFYFSVFLPSLPYTIFMITVVGWTLGVIQTVVAAPLWAVMHMRPSQTFVGSDAQGYLLLLAMFVRPALAIIGLFSAMLVADPIVDYIARSFFEMRGAVVTSTGLVGSIIEFANFYHWLFTFGIVLTPVLYMIFGLPNALPDHVLRWLNVGVHDLGATSATSNVRGGLATGAIQGGSPASRSLPSGDAATGGPGLSNGLPPAFNQSINSNSADPQMPINAGEQGVSPSSNPIESDIAPPFTSARSAPISGGHQGTGRVETSNSIESDMPGSFELRSTNRHASPDSSPMSAGIQGAHPDTSVGDSGVPFNLNQAGAATIDVANSGSATSAPQQIDIESRDSHHQNANASPGDIPILGL